MHEIETVRDRLYKVSAQNRQKLIYPPPPCSQNVRTATPSLVRADIP